MVRCILATFSGLLHWRRDSLPRAFYKYPNTSMGDVFDCIYGSIILYTMFLLISIMPTTVASNRHICFANTKIDHRFGQFLKHYCDVIMGAMASQITSLTIVCSTVYSGADEGKHQSSALMTFVRGIHRWPVNSPHKGPVTRKMFPFDDVIMKNGLSLPRLRAAGGHVFCCRRWDESLSSTAGIVWW